MYFLKLLANSKCKSPFMFFLLTERH